MPKQKFHLFGILDLHPETGRIYCEDESALIWSASSYIDLQRSLVKQCGADEARRIIFHAGYLHGFNAELTTQQLLGIPIVKRPPGLDPRGEEVGTLFPSLFGLGKGEIIKLVVEQDVPSLWMESIHHYSVEAEQYLNDIGNSSYPVCWWATAFSSGYISAGFKSEVYFKEVACVAQGAPVCHLVGKDAASWGEEAEALRLQHGFRNTAEVEEFQFAQYELRKSSRKKRVQADVTWQGTSSGNAAIRERVSRIASENGFIVREEPMWLALENAARVAKMNMPVLIQGETGTGKEFVANLIHSESKKSSGPLVSINCAALTESLLESELFGHVRGAFTGAVSHKEGLLEAASDGTLFLDEIAEMPLLTQAKLLRVLESGEMRRVGSTQTIQVNPRILSATHRDLQVLAVKGEFRLDLYFRLNGFVVDLPPLRERPNTISALVQRFIEESCESFEKNVDSVSPEAMSRLLAYTWPGNVRNLKHVIEHAVVVAREPVIRLQDLPQEISYFTAASTDSGALSASSQSEMDEMKTIKETLARNRGNRTATAHQLRISSSTLWRKMRQYGLK
jgi:DNA-binding NtrC family response regulator